MSHKDPEDKRVYERKYYRKRKKKNPKYFQKYHRALRYGLTSEQFELMLETQNNQCAVCRKVFTDTPCVDHKHATNEIRGLLCGNCNKGLGHFFDDSEILLSALAYLKQYGG